MMSTEEKIVSGVLALLTVLLVWFGYSHGAENLPVLLTIGGGFVFAVLGNSGHSDNGLLICVVLILVGVIFAWTGAGLLVAGALLLGAIFAGIATAIVA